MPSNVSDYGSNFIAGAMFGKTVTLPTNYYLALTQIAPDPSVSAASLAEPVGGAYARVTIPNNSTYFNNAVGGTITNKLTLTFPVSTADWGVVAWWVLCDAAINGNIIMYASLAMPRLIQSGSTMSFQAGQLSFAVTGQRRTIIGGSG